MSEQDEKLVVGSTSLEMMEIWENKTKPRLYYVPKQLAKGI
jgi:hypothetical protein